MIEKPGFYLDMSAPEYHGDPCPMPSLNQSLIPTMLDRSPFHAAFQHPRLNPYGTALQSSLTQYLGEAVHRLALGRGREISTIRYNDYKHSSARADRDLAVANGRIPILENELAKAKAMARVVRSAIEEACEGHPYETEVALFWIEETPFGQVWCRGLMDVFCRPLGLVLDPKALRIPATAGAFGKAAGDAGYDIQSVWYPRGVEALMPEMTGRVKFKNLVVENTEPHGIAVFEADAETRATAELDVTMAINLFGHCLATRRWPSYPRKAQTYSTPAYRKTRTIERSISAFEA